MPAGPAGGPGLARLGQEGQRGRAGWALGRSGDGVGLLPLGRGDFSFSLYLWPLGRPASDQVAAPWEGRSSLQAAREQPQSSLKAASKRPQSNHPAAPSWPSSPRVCFAHHAVPQGARARPQRCQLIQLWLAGQRAVLIGSMADAWAILRNRRRPSGPAGLGAAGVEWDICVPLPDSDPARRGRRVRPSLCHPSFTRRNRHSTRR